MKSRHLTKVTNNKHLPQAPSVIVSHDKTFVCQKCDIFEHHFPPPPPTNPQKIMRQKYIFLNNSRGITVFFKAIKDGMHPAKLLTQRWTIRVFMRGVEGVVLGNYRK